MDENDNPADQKFAKDSLQLSIYALAAKEVFKWPVDELILYYLYENSVLSATREDEALEKTKTRIQGIAENIQTQNFEAKTGRHCQWCEYKKICPSF